MKKQTEEAVHKSSTEKKKLFLVMAFNTTNADVLVLLNILQLTTVDLKSAINTSFVLLTTFIILTMQIGFGMLQSGNRFTAYFK